MALRNRQLKDMMSRSRFRPVAVLAAAAGALLAALGSIAQEPAGGTVVRMEIRGAIGPATSAYVLEGLEQARDTQAALVLIEMDTPGGLDSAMREIIKGILSSEVPVVTWVSPSGSRAASAGTYILYASHIAAMAPATNLGAATPVAIGGGGPPLPAPAQRPRESGAEGGDIAAGDDTADDADGATEPAPAAGTAMEKKSVNDAVAYIRSLAELRGRNADWAERAVREAASLSAAEAADDQVIDVVAATRDELFAAIDGRVVKVGDGEVELATAGLVIEEFEADWRTRLLATITDPNIAYMLLLVGIYGLILEGYNPGALVPGVVGAICLLLALFAFQVLPVNYAGLGLILLGVILMIAEAFAPSFGALGLGGIVAFVIGSIILLDTDVPGFQISRMLIGSVAALGGSLLLGLMYFLMRSFRRPVVSGAEQMIGSTAEVLEDFFDVGPVLAHGERWRAHAKGQLRRGDRVQITGMRGLELEVEKQD
jgi:membrane-bound serine protease (ClpP class)